MSEGDLLVIRPSAVPVLRNPPVAFGVALVFRQAIQRGAIPSVLRRGLWPGWLPARRSFGRRTVSVGHGSTDHLAGDSLRRLSAEGAEKILGGRGRGQGAA